MTTDILASNLTGFPETSGTDGPPVFPLAQLDSLLAETDRLTGPADAALPRSTGQTDNQLVQVRMGIASSLYAALRFRCASAAAHSLRVALNCSAWSAAMSLDDRLRDEIELAALLHDIGTIGVPDQILWKAGPLDADEHMVFEESRRMTVEILRSSCASRGVLEIVENLGAWFDGSRGGFKHSREEIPLGARMIAIVEAFDSMTSDQVFRRALSEERAIRELFAFAGRQFDPALVRQFGEFYVSDPAERRREVSQRWLHSLDPQLIHSYWELNVPEVAAASHDPRRAFQDRLIENMHDAVVFIDSALRILEWNHGAERMTGISASGVSQRAWSPSMLNIQNEKGGWLADDDCPVHWALRSGTQSLRRLTIAGRAGRSVQVDSHTIPVAAADGSVIGAVLILHDASSQTSLEERCQNLHEKATKDPLTQVANRAEFDRVHEMFIRANQEQQIPCALVMCDLDHFKQVNDNFGHPAGDEVIKCLASLLRDSCRPGDLVARYGGEEFVMLCADCNNATAARRAEAVRKRLSRIPQAMLEGRRVTASFGVTEVQPGDTPETMLRRADRALLTAKEKGRNRVLQLGVGADDEKRQSGLLSWWRGEGENEPPPAIEQDLITPVPLAVAIEKLRGFVADQRADILKIDGNHVQLKIDDGAAGQMRRASDRPVSFLMDLQLSEERLENADRYQGTSAAVSRTRIQVKIVPYKGRDRRRADIPERGRDLMASFRSYLIATEDEQGERRNVLRKASKILTPWLLR